MIDTPKIDDTRIAAIIDIATPQQLINEIPVDEKATHHIARSRQNIEAVLQKNDDRLLVVTGPCSIHDPIAAIEYAKRLAQISEQFSDSILIVMRVYFEKPRTTVGWKGLINDPDLDNSFEINKGLRLARQLLLDINNFGLPCATEFLDIISPQFIADLIAWGAIGARTTESQIHRELASGLSCPIGFKNSTDGNIKIAVDAINSASQAHRFLSIKKEGQLAISQSSGNPFCHIILRGGGGSTNYSAKDIDMTSDLLQKSGLSPAIMVDCSHANSNKDYTKQMDVVDNLCLQITAGDSRIMGVMIESNLVAGNQNLDLTTNLVYGQSITDACIDWDTTVNIIEKLALAVNKRREHL